MEAPPVPTTDPVHVCAGLLRGKGIAHCFGDANATTIGIPVERGELWYEYFDEYYQLTIAMIFGSLIAGSTPLGGGVVAFPVVVLAIGLSPPEGRDFTVCIQSVGMNAAGFLLMVVKPVRNRMHRAS